MPNRLNRPSRRRQPEAALITAGGQLILSPKLAAFKRFYRWLNLTLVHQAIWPLLVLLTAATAEELEQTPLGWYLARLAAPTLAALLAIAYLRQRPLPELDTPSIDAYPDAIPSNGREGRRARAAQQAQFLLLGLPVIIAALRLAQGPVEPAAKLLLFGFADVAAYHLIHFGVVVRSYPDPTVGISSATLFFALSWGIHDALLTAIGTSDTPVVLAFAGGSAIGLVIALLMRAVRRWPGGWLTAAATHWLLIYLILGFAG